MTESEEQENTKCSSKERLPRSHYLELRREVTRSKLRDFLKDGGSLQLVTPMTEVVSGKQKVLFKCSCGREFLARPVDVLKTGQALCNPCTRRKVMQGKVGTQPWRTHQQGMVVAAVKANTKDPRFVALRRRCNAVKARCCSPTCAAYRYYGGRGIEFRFESPLAMAEWVVANLGYPDAGGSLSIDRRDNLGHYEPGNLRWATADVQGNNKRPYAVDQEGGRIRRLRGIRPDYSYESVRSFVRQGLSDEQIISKKKWGGCGDYIRHS